MESGFFSRLGTLRMNYIGIDLAKRTFTATGLRTPKELFFFGKTFKNIQQGFEQFLQYLSTYNITQDHCKIVMESTGVYGDKIRHYLFHQQYLVHVEPAAYIRRAFRLKSKTDPIDSRMIAEYGFRYDDQLHLWTPQEEIVEQIQAYLVIRELLIKERTAHKNSLKALSHKERHLAHSHNDIIDFLSEQIDEIEEVLNVAIKPYDQYRDHIHNLQSIPGCGLLFALNFFVMSDGFKYLDFRSLARYCGIIPNSFESGDRIYKKPKSDRQGPERMRKVLYLCAMSSLRRKDERFYKYFQRKIAERPDMGKLFLNNIKNQMLKIACAIVRDGVPYTSSCKSKNPNL